MKHIVLSLLSGCIFAAGWCILTDGIVQADAGQFLWYVRVFSLASNALTRV
jgi:hypothetical protein